MKNKSIKDQILALTGMSEKKFYDKYINPEDFKKDYPKEFAKILRNGGIAKAQGGWQETISPAPLEMESYDFDSNQKKINRDANKIRKQNIRQGIGLDSRQGVMDESIQEKGFGQRMSDNLSNLDSEDLETGFQAASSIGRGVQNYASARATKKKANYTNMLLKGLAPLINQASSGRLNQIDRRYNRPDDPNRIMQPDQFQNPYGQGTNILSAKNGREITITNKYNPETVKFPQHEFYTDLKKADAGLIIEGINTAGDIASWIGGMGTKKLQKENQEIISNLGVQPGIQNIQNSQYVSHMENGGVMNPQIINQFGDYRMNQLLQPDPYMDTLRSGGNLKNYTPPSNRAMETYEDGGNLQFSNSAMNGDLKTHWGGDLKLISTNKFQTGNGQNFEIVGNSHDDKDALGRSGVGLSVGDTGNSDLQDYAEFGSKKATGKSVVEAEGGETIREVQNPDGSMNTVIHGNLTVSKNGANLIGNPKFANMKVKNIIKNLTKDDNKLNKNIEKHTNFLQNLKVDDPYSKLSFNSAKASIDGNNSSLRESAEFKEGVESYQDAVNTTAQEMGIDADALSKGKVKFDKKSESEKARFGKNILKAQNGLSVEEKSEATKLYRSGDVKGFQEYAQKIAPDIVKSILKEKGMPRAGKFADSMSGFRTEDAYKQMMALPERGGSTRPNEIQVPSNAGSVDLRNPQSNVTGKKEDGKFDWMDIASTISSQALPYLRPRGGEELDPNQLAGEMYALSTNQLEPVQAQTFQPQLSTPYDVSFQDQLNANQSDYRAVQRMTGYNPAALATLNAQKYQANQQVLANQFRENQAMKDRVYGENRQLLNESNLANLEIYDRQYGRQSDALSKTKATTQAALSSIASKYAQNELQNKTLQTYENLYDYRFDPRMRAINMNPLQQFNTQIAGAPVSSEEDVKKANKPKNARNGYLVKAFK